MVIYVYAFLVLWLLNSFKDIAIKHSLKNINTWLLAWFTSLFTIIFSIPFLISEWLPTQFWENFIWVLIFGWIFYYFWKFFNFTALSLWDISLISPMKWLVTFSVVLTSILLLWEKVSFFWWIWLFLIVAWTYILAIEKTHTNILSPIKALWKNKWSRIYLICIMFYWFTVTLDRMWVKWSSLWFWTICMNSFVFLFSIPDFIKHKNVIFSSFKKVYLSFFMIVILHFIVYVSQMYIVSQILAPYTSAFKTSSSLFAVILWWWFFKEKWLFKRFIAATIILSWVTIISFFWWVAF